MMVSTEKRLAAFQVLMSQCGSKLNEALAIATLKDRGVSPSSRPRRTMFLTLLTLHIRILFFQIKNPSLCSLALSLLPLREPGLACCVPSIMCVHLCSLALFMVLITWPWPFNLCGSALKYNHDVYNQHLWLQNVFIPLKRSAVPIQ